MVARVVALRVKEGAGTDDFLFVGPGGAQCTTAGMAMAWDAMAVGYVTNDAGMPTEARLTRQSPRRSGAQLLIRRGRPLAEVQYMGRWGSAVVERYVAEARAMVSTRAAFRGDAVRMSHCDVALWELQEEVEKLRLLSGEIAEIRKIVLASTSPALEPLRLSDSLTQSLVASRSEGSVDDVGARPYVLYAESGKLHKCDWMRGDPQGDRGRWITRCGLLYGAAKFVHSARSDLGAPCRKSGCFTLGRKGGPPAEVSDTSGGNVSSGSSSGSS